MSSSLRTFTTKDSPLQPSPSLSCCTGFAHALSFLTTHPPPPYDFQTTFPPNCTLHGRFMHVHTSQFCAWTVTLLCLLIISITLLLRHTIKFSFHIPAVSNYHCRTFIFASLLSLPLLPILVTEGLTIESVIYCRPWVVHPSWNLVTYLWIVFFVSLASSAFSITYWVTATLNVLGRKVSGGEDWLHIPEPLTLMIVFMPITGVICLGMAPLGLVLVVANHVTEYVKKRWFAEEVEMERRLGGVERGMGWGGYQQGELLELDEEEDVGRIYHGVLQDGEV